MALNPVNVLPKTSGGKGGLFGKIAGGVVGGVAGTFAGNPLGGAALGSSIGETVGTVADPVKQSGGQGVALSALAKDPGVQLANLVDAQKTLMASNDFTEPEKQELINGVYMPAMDALRKRKI